MWVVGLVLVTPLILAKGGQLVNNSSTGWLTLGLFVSVVIYGGVVLWLLASRLGDDIPHGSRGVIRLDLTHTGFSLEYRTGPPVSRGWAELREPLRVEDYSENGPTHGSKLSLKRGLRPPLWVAITNEAAAGLAAFAQARGLKLEKGEVVTSLGAHGRLYLIAAPRPV
jgi:hypothetical protein